MNRFTNWKMAMRTRAMISVAIVGILLFSGLPTLGGTEHARQTEGEDWKPVSSLSDIATIPPGAQYIARLDRENLTLVPMDLPDKTAGLSENALKAIDRAPEWLREDLIANFGKTAETRIDVGEFSTVSFADVDRDGDTDLVAGAADGTLKFLENMGTGNMPIFVRDDTFFEGYYPESIAGGLERSAPALGDLDSDGDFDIVLGHSGGSLYYMENKGSADVAVWDLPRPVATANEDSNSHPVLWDLDEDKDLDLAVGNGRGTLSYYENVGSLSEFNFEPRPLKFSGIDVGSDSSPSFADLDDDGDGDLTLGGSPQILRFYRNIAGVFTNDPTVYGTLQVPVGPAPSLVRLFADRRLDLVIGTQEGVIRFIDNIGTSSIPEWQTWSSFEVFEGVEYYGKEGYITRQNHVRMDRFADLIVNAEPKLRDEIAFSIAHASPDILKRMNDTQAQSLVENAEYIYIIDEYLDYADLLEKDDYTTVVYNTLTESGEVHREIPRDIYYWYIVHPHVTDENVGYVSPENGSMWDPEDGGRFWREYLFYHADANYPPDPGTGHQYPDTPPPRLKDILEGIDLFFNDTKYFAPPDRDPYFGEHAVIRVSNWVGKTLALNEQESADGERPIQPVRIAHHHNGNCGELQDLTIAAARTALIPAKGVSLLGEDHVWIEFYENGWHQWDNYWSDGGSVIANYNTYWGGWGERGGSGIFSWDGDDDTEQVTERYLPDDVETTVTFKVRDRNGNPVDGARILVGSHWLLKTGGDLYKVTVPFPSIWDYTDLNGEVTFTLAPQEHARDANKNFSFKVISRLGNDEQPKTELEQGEEYVFEFFLDGALPYPEPRTTESPVEGRDLSLDVDYRVDTGQQYPPNPVDGNTHPEMFDTNLFVDTMIVNETNLNAYLSGEQFESMVLRTRQFDDNFTFEFGSPSDSEDVFIIISNERSIETSVDIQVDIDLNLRLAPPDVEILLPLDGTEVIAGDVVVFEGRATGVIPITQLHWSRDKGVKNTDITNRLRAGLWNYTWNTTGMEPGSIEIMITAINDEGLQDVDWVTLDIGAPDTQPPSLDILRPSDGSIFQVGTTVLVEGTAADASGLTDLGISYDGGGSWHDLMAGLTGNHWNHTWVTEGLPPGTYTVLVQAEDLPGNIANEAINVRIVSGGGDVDQTPPTISITHPADGARIEAGTVVEITGSASDKNGIEALELSLDRGDSWLDIFGYLYGGSWSYTWDTEYQPDGENVITVRGEDGAGNKGSDSVTLEIFNGSGPGPGPVVDIEPPSVTIDAPPDGTVFDEAETVVISGSASDNIEVSWLRISFDNYEYDILPYLVRGSFSFDVPQELLIPGTHWIRVEARDPDGNRMTDDIAIEIEAVKKDGDDEWKLDNDDLSLLVIVFLLLIIVTVLVLSVRGAVNRRRQTEQLEKARRRKRSGKRSRAGPEGKKKIKKKKIKRKK
jgi:hypothetical protein